MKLEDIQVTGSVFLTGSFTLPNHASSNDVSNLQTGSLYNDTTDSVVKVYNGTSWVVVGEQDIPPVEIEYLIVAGGGSGGGVSTTGGYHAGGGGGGAGGLLSGSYEFTSGTQYSFTVGAGGATANYNANDGSDSTGFGVTSVGG